MTQEKYLAVNWVDGMKINKSHFISESNAFIQQMSMTAGGLVNPYTYGLLPVQNAGMPSLFVSADNQQEVQLRLPKCRAITMGGHLIVCDENENTINRLTTQVPGMDIPSAEMKGRKIEYYVVLTVNPFKKIPTGKADPEETPLRLPHVAPHYELGLIPINEAGRNVLGDFQLPVGKLTTDEQKILVDNDYIPPCATVASHRDLMEVHAGLEEFFNKMELYSLQVIQKIMQKKQQTDMALIVQYLSTQVCAFTACHLNNFRQYGEALPPVTLFNTVCSFARTIKNSLDMYIGSGKEELGNYCIEWCEVQEGELESIITALCNHRYDHLNINYSIEKVVAFTKTISRLFKNFSRLDYIGKRKDTGIFVKEQIVTAEPELPVKKRRSFLAD